MENNDDQLVFNSVPYEATTITLMLGNSEEIIKLSKDGFFYKGKLIVEDQEIYLRFKEWLDLAIIGKGTSEPLNLNSIEERDNVITLMREALKFYGEKGNYDAKHPLNGELYSMVDVDAGSTARFALDKVNELIEANERMQNEYDSLIMEASNFYDVGETNPIHLIRVFDETRKEEDNLTKMRRQGNENPIV